MWPPNDVIRGDAVPYQCRGHEEGDMALGGYQRNGQSLHGQMDPPR
jgi:hypothetical protein